MFECSILENIKSKPLFLSLWASIALILSTYITGRIPNLEDTYVIFIVVPIVYFQLLQFAHNKEIEHGQLKWSEKAVQYHQTVSNYLKEFIIQLTTPKPLQKFLKQVKSFFYYFFSTIQSASIYIALWFLRGITIGSLLFVLANFYFASAFLKKFKGIDIEDHFSELQSRIDQFILKATKAIPGYKGKKID